MMKFKNYSLYYYNSRLYFSTAIDITLIMLYNYLINIQLLYLL